MTRDFCVNVHRKLHEMSLIYMGNLKFDVAVLH